MHCASCSILIDGDLEDSEGVVSAKTNYVRQISEVEYDERKINVNKILFIIRKTGYQAEVISS